MPKRFNRMLEIRQLTGMSQEEVAVMLNTSRSNVAMHETTGRGLPGNASLYLGLILVEMYKPENQASIPTAALSASDAEKWKKELLWLASKRRHEAEQLKRKMDARTEKETQRRNRLLRTGASPLAPERCRFVKTRTCAKRRQRSWHKATAQRGNPLPTAI